jgi:hypothetical protein
MSITILTGSDGTMTQQDPIFNMLQNLALALKGVQMMHMRPTLIQTLLISKDMHDHLLTMVLAVVASNTKAAIVLPAFAHFSNCSFVPQEEALACLESEWGKWHSANIGSECSVTFLSL